MYILLRQLTYEGYIVNAFKDKETAEKLYNECLPKTDPEKCEAVFTAIALIEGNVLKEIGIGGDLTPQV